MMKAVAVSKFRDTPQVMELPKPAVRPGMVLVRVAAAGMNPFDWKMVDGIMEGHMPHQFPLIMGVEGAGTVAAVGEGVTRFKEGDKIYGQFIHSPIGEGAYAEYAIVPENNEVDLAPASIALTAAAAVPNAGMTAPQLLEKMALQKGQTVLIVGATGGVGSFATQLAALQGLQVIATAGNEASAARMQQLGAAATVNYKTAPVAQQVKQLYPHGIDGLIDLMSDKETFAANTALLKPGGVTMTTAFVADEAALQAQGLRGGNFETKGDVPSLNKLTKLIDDGRLQVPVGKNITLEEVPAAVAQSRAGHATGKTVIIMPS
jgi:NADPH:quinone reductase-like Zn-dependent oxidoreductase